MTYIAYNHPMIKINPKLKFIRYEDWSREVMKDPEVKAAYDALELEFSIIRRRIEKDMSQKQLAKKIGSDQSVISRLEAGNYNPSIKFLKRVAKALDTKLKVTLL